ncbi:MAG: hypothetical protein COW00_07765 [Bdellovibrio sp. CG12_big_fil_rev_8_21_14_0_65_39_13]|nr:MAG: hypothetical protein COW00_07765 [Bdellovibrio sp. CG12_big_fil_rev_8_21_14_0_65_39_13]
MREPFLNVYDFFGVKNEISSCSLCSSYHDFISLALPLQSSWSLNWAATYLSIFLSNKTDELDDKIVMKNILISLVLLTLSLACQSPHRTIANSDNDSQFWNIEPKRNIKEVDVHSETEQVVKLRNAKVVIVDYDLIKRDFPVMKNYSDSEIDKWLIDQVGYVSIPQTKQTIVNTAIPTTGELIDAHRPTDYGRALVFDMKDPVTGNEIGIMDVKGVGALRPGQRDHGNGVATLGETIREFVYENMMRRVLKDSELTQKTVGSYAVIDPGFDVVHADGSTSPAGFYVRQGHDRVPQSGAWLPEDLRMKIQNVFHQYGVDPNRNIQGTKNHEGIFDFGHYVVRDDLKSINPNKQIPFAQWGYDKSIKAEAGDRWFYSKKDYPWNWSHEFADNWRKGHANRDDAWRHFLNMLSPVEKKLKTGIGGQSCLQLMNHLLQ